MDPAMNDLGDFSEDEEEDMSVAIGKQKVLELPKLTPD